MPEVIVENSLTMSSSSAFSNGPRAIHAVTLSLWTSSPQQLSNIGFTFLSPRDERGNGYISRSLLCVLSLCGGNIHGCPGCRVSFFYGVITARKNRPHTLVSPIYFSEVKIRRVEMVNLFSSSWVS